MESGQSKKSQHNERLKIKRKMSDVLIDLISAKIGIDL